MTKTLHLRGGPRMGPLEDRIEFRLLIGIAVIGILPFAAISRLLPRGRRPMSTPSAGESLFAEARRTAYTVVPYAFMR